MSSTHQEGIGMNKSICSNDVALKDLLVAINQQPAGIAFIVDNQQKLCGVITDGDFRRMLLSGRTLEDFIQQGDLKEFVYAKQGEAMDDLLKKTDHKVRFIPIVDDQFHLVDYFRYEHRLHMTPVAEPDLKGNEYKYVSDALLSTWISSRGAYIEKFEKEFAAFSENDLQGISVSNGTVALLLALKALDIGQGDEVIVPDLTFAATINAVLHANATPVVVDVNMDDWCISPEAIEDAISPRTKAIIPVHLYGQPCQMDRIMDIAKKNKLFVIEDCAEAHGASFQGKKVGTFGDIATFSFYGNKIITTGEGGMCLTQQSELANKMKVLRDHGMNPNKRYWHDVIGFNFRLTNLQAAVGCAQLERIESIIARRKEIEAQYKKHLQHLSFIDWQRDFDDRKRVVWLVAGLVSENRDALMDHLKRDGIETRPFFYPLSSMPIYKSYCGKLTNSLSISARGINLPTLEEISFPKIIKSFESFA